MQIERERKRKREREREREKKKKDGNKNFCNYSFTLLKGRGLHGRSSKNGASDNLYKSHDYLTEKFTLRGPELVSWFNIYNKKFNACSALGPKGEESIRRKALRLSLSLVFYSLSLMNK